MNKKSSPSYIEYPPDPSIPIWRYMSFSKYVSMLAHSSLYFARADKFQDKYEGYLNKKADEIIDSLFYEYSNSAEMQRELRFLFHEVRKLTLVNCWHMNENESDGMWQVYALENEGIAIRSTIERLKSCFRYDNNALFIRPVRYVNYDTDRIEQLHPTELFVRKRKAFQWENELRVIILRFETAKIADYESKFEAGEKIPVDYVEHGELIPIDFNTLVEKVYVSPRSPKWFFELVKKLTKLTYKIDVLHSDVYSEPDT